MFLRVLVLISVFYSLAIFAAPSQTTSLSSAKLTQYDYTRAPQSVIEGLKFPQNNLALFTSRLTNCQ